MRKFILLAGIVAVAATAPAAFAGGSPHFIKSATSSSISGSSLVCNFKEAGLSAGSTETITCGATEAVTYECVNGGGRNPAASNKTTFHTSGESSGEFTADRNGNLVGAQTLDVTSPGALNFSCPGGQKLTLVSVYYTNVTVTDDTSGALLSLANQSYVNPSAP
jgi:hypothetical protein